MSRYWEMAKTAPAKNNKSKTTKVIRIPRLRQPFLFFVFREGGRACPPTGVGWVLLPTGFRLGWAEAVTRSFGLITSTGWVSWGTSVPAGVNATALSAVACGSISSTGSGRITSGRGWLAGVSGGMVSTKSRSMAVSWRTGWVIGVSSLSSWTKVFSLSSWTKCRILSVSIAQWPVLNSSPGLA